MALARYEARAPSSCALGGSAWQGNPAKLDEVLAFQAKQRPGETLLAEFRTQQRQRRADAARNQARKPGPAAMPLVVPAETTRTPERRPDPRPNLSGGRDAGGRWSGDPGRLDEVLAFQAKQRSSGELLAEFKAECRSRGSSARHSPALAPSMPKSILEPPEAEPQASEGFQAGSWDGDAGKLDQVLAFHLKQRDSDEILQEFKSQKNSPSPSPRSSPRFSPRISPVEQSAMLLERACPSPLVGGLKGELTPPTSPNSKSPNSPLGVGGQWERDPKRLDEVLAYQTKIRPTDVLIAEFKAEKKKQTDKKTGW